MIRCLLLLALLFTTPAVLADETNYAQLSLPHGVRVKVPKNWWIVGKDMNATIATVQEATLEMSGVDIPKFKQTLLFRASSMPKTTYASISVTATDPDMTSDDLAQVTPEILREIDPISRDAIRKMLKAGGYELESFEPIKVVKMNGLLAMEMNYQRSGPKGPVMVRTLNLPVGDKSIVFTLSYRKAEAGLWKVTTEYMKSSIEIRK